MRRTITVTLTDKQFLALAGAIGDSEITLRDIGWDDTGGSASARRDLDVLLRAWAKIKAAWYR